MDAEKATFDCWAVLELFGHVRLAGRVTEASIGGCSFLRVDVPEREGDAAKFTRYFGNGAIYSMTPVTEEVARRVGDGNAAAAKFTRYFGNGAIYSMTPVTEEVARRVGDGNAAAPVKPWEMPKAALPAADSHVESPTSGDDDDDIDHPW